MNFASFMNSASFPPIIQHYFQEHPEMDDDHVLPGIFAENGGEKIRFINWVLEHQFVALNTPRLFKAINLAIDPPSQIVEQARQVNDLYLMGPNDETIMNVENNLVFNNDAWVLIQKVLADSSCTIDEFPVNYALMALDLHQAGIITEPQLISLMSKCDKNGLLPLQNIGTLNDVLSSLNAQYSAFFAILSIKNNADQTLLHLPEFFEILWPLFLGRNPESILPLLSCRENAGLMQDDGGKTPLHNPIIFKSAIPILRRLNSSNHIKLLSVQDNSDRTVLHHPLNLKNAVELLEDLNPNDRNALLSIKDASGNSSGSNLKSIDLLGIKNDQGNTPLHSFESFKSSLDDLGELPPDDLYRILLKDDAEGNTPLHYTDILELALPLLEKMPAEFLFRLFTITNNDCDTPLCYLDSFQAAMPLLAKLKSEDLVKILGGMLVGKSAIELTTLLHDEDTFQMAIPVLEKLQPDDLIDLLSSKKFLKKSRFRISHAKPLLHYINIVQLAMPLIEKLREEELVKLLYFPNEYGTPLSRKNILEAFIPLLQKLKPKDLILFLFPSQGKAPVRNAKTLAIATTILKKLDPSFLIDAFSINNLMNSYDEDVFNKNCVEVFPLLVPYLEEFNNDDLKRYFSVKDTDENFRGGKTLLFHEIIFKLALPFLEKLEPKVLLELLSIQSNTDQTVLFDANILELAIPLLKKLEAKDLVHLFSIKGYNPIEKNESEESEDSDEEKDYTTALHNPNTLERAMPFLETLDSDILFEIFSIRDDKGLTLLHHDDVYKILSSLLPKIKVNHLINFLDIWKVALHTIPLLCKLETAELVACFSMLDEDGLTPLHDPKIFEIVLSLLKTSDLNVVMQLLSIKNADGQIPLHNADIFEMAQCLLVKLSEEDLNYLFSVQDDAGETVLHNPLIFGQCNTALYLYGKLNPEVFQIRNRSGFFPEEWSKLYPSMEWLRKAKFSNNVKPLSEEEYQEKSRLLKKSLGDMWGSFVFGDQENDVPDIFLEMEVSGETEIYSPKKIKKTLDRIVDKIITKMAWLGTPRENDTQGLHLFYSQMLINFGQLLEGLNLLGSARERAGPLIGIAKVELEGRCAAAYQSEIEQARMVVVSNSNTEEAGLDVSFNKLGCAALIECIQKIVMENYEADSHVFNQMLFAAGLVSNSDPLVRVSVPHCQELIVAEWTKDLIISSLAESIGRLGVEQLQYWFELLTPEEYGQNFHIKQKALQRQEQDIVKDLKAQLVRKGFGELLINSCVEIFQSTQGAGLRIGSTVRKCISEAVFNKLAQASSIEELGDIQIFLTQEKEKDSLRMKKLLDTEDELKEKLKNLGSAEDKSSADWIHIELDGITDERKSLQQKNFGLMNEFTSLKLNAERKIKLADLLKKTHPNLSSEELDVIFPAKQQFDIQISDLAESEGVNFVPCESGLPSTAVEKSRRGDYASQFFTADQDEIQKLNKKGVVEILLRIGVLKTT